MVIYRKQVINIKTKTISSWISPKVSPNTGDVFKCYSGVKQNAQ